MSRDIRNYRGKTINGGEWVVGCYAYHKIPLSEIIEHIIIVDGFKTHLVHPETVGQYFGFDDSNETELFPGDVVITRHTRIAKNGKIDIDPFNNVGYEEYEKIGVLEEYWGHKFGPRLRWKKGHMLIPNTTSLKRMKAEKIGNIHDHPNLLEAKA